jgi:Tol biopolymer transport system component
MAANTIAQTILTSGRFQTAVPSIRKRETIASMPRGGVAFGVAVLLLTTSVGAQQLAFSRRVYVARGTSYQQLWIWSAADGRLTQLTRSPRDHRNPGCSPDGRQIFFDSFSTRDERWRFDRTTGLEELINGSEPGHEPAALDTARIRVPGCDDGTWARSRDRSKAVCTANGEDLVVVDLNTSRETDRIRFGQHYRTGEPYPRWALQSTWSPDDRILLVGIYAGNSTVSAMDFFLLDLSRKRWTRAMTGNNPVWLPDSTAIVYETPRDLVPLTVSGTHRVWSAHLARFDVATRTETLLTSGVTNDRQPVVCGR